MRKLSALILGVSGQDGSYLAKRLLDDGYYVIGQLRNPPSELWRHVELEIKDHPRLALRTWDITDPAATAHVVEEFRPKEIYNFASNSFVGVSLNAPYDTAMVTAVATVNLLDAVSRFSPSSRIFLAGSSEMFGNALQYPQHEATQFRPRNIYGSSKVFAYLAANNYRESAKVYCSTGIFYNHESPLRGLEFVTRKVTHAVAKIKAGNQTSLSVGNLSAERDWGYAEEYVDAVRLVLAHDEPGEFVLATGISTSVREFVQMAFRAADLEVEFTGEGLYEQGFEVKSGRVLVSVHEKHFRPLDQVPLVGDASKARQVLGWTAKTPVHELVRLMVESDLSRLSKSS
jgi:GDPmannose 4,6-dehydratase